MNLPENANKKLPLHLRLLQALQICLITVLIIFIPLEVRQFYVTFLSVQENPLISWLVSINWQWIYHLVWAIFGFILVRKAYSQLKEVTVQNLQPAPTIEQKTKLSPLIIGICCGFLNLAVNLYTAFLIGNHHPVYHDEYSYLFQCETFLAGKLSNERFEPAPELFDQVHVLNLSPHHFASRYFPGVGLFLMPSLIVGLPHLSHWISGMLICLLISLTGYEIKGTLAAWWSGIICALLPGYSLFANVLLSHHPALLGLSFFLYWQIRLMKSPGFSYAFMAGTGLSYAMLCRPMTAAGFALPFGIWWLGWFFNLVKQHSNPGSVFLLFPRLLITSGMAIPLLAGLGVMLIYNQATTGSCTTTPYQQYTDHYTPSHVYGFYNKTRGQAHIKSAIEAGHPLPVLNSYDQWAEELTPFLALQKAGFRLLATAPWTIGIIPLILLLLMLLLTFRFLDSRIIWIMASILTLHLVHIPYWFVGIFNWHYVMEAGIEIALLMGLLTAVVISEFKAVDYPAVGKWWIAGILINLVISFTSFAPFWPSMLMEGAAEISFVDKQFAEVDKTIKEHCRNQPSLIVIKPDLANLHTDFVVNHPVLKNSLYLRARYLPEKYPLEKLSQLFPQRDVWLYDIQAKKMQLIARANK